MKQKIYIKKRNINRFSYFLHLNNFTRQKIEAGKMMREKSQQLQQANSLDHFAKKNIQH